MRAVRLLWKLFARLMGVVLILVMLALAYLHVYGFPPFLIQAIEDQLARTGLAARFASIRLELFRGVVATNARLADINTPEQTLVEIDEVQLHLSARRLWQGRNVIDALYIANAVVAVPLPADQQGREYFTARGAFATLVFEEDGTVAIDRLMGEYCGVRLFVRGRFKPKSATTGPLEPVRPEQFLFLTRVVRELNRIRVTTPPEMDLEFDVDMARPLLSSAHLRLRGSAIDYRGLHVDRAAVDLLLKAGAVSFQEFMVGLYGGEVHVAGRYDLARGQFDLEATSTTDPTALAGLAPPAVATVLQEIRVEENPRLRLRYALSPETGSLPHLEGEVDTAGFTVRKAGAVPVDFRAVRARFHSQGPDWRVTEAHIVMREGELTGQGSFHLESSDFAYQLESTLDPTKLLPLLLPRMRAIVEPSWFESPPHIRASVVGDFVDPDNFAYDAVVDAQRCRYRGVELQAATGKLRLRQSRLQVEDLALRRPEGAATGTLLAEFNLQRLTFDVRCTANPNELAPLLGPRAGPLLKPYRFGPRTDGQAAGVIDFAAGTNTAWKATVANEGFGWWKLHATRAAAELTYTNNTLAIEKVKADFYDGKLNGAAGFVFAPAAPIYQLAWQADGCDVEKLMADLQGGEHKVSGRLWGKLALHGQGSDLNLLRGEGGVEIRDGVLLEVPVFGIFSRILDEISPGLGQAKATRAEATFKVAKQLVKTEDLRISAGAFTLSSAGAVALDGELDFRVKAQILRQVPLFNIPGIILGKIFEYKVGGTLGNPSYRPVHLPKELLPHSGSRDEN